MSDIRHLTGTPEAAAPKTPEASRPIGFLDALAGHSAHEIRQQIIDPELCSRCQRRPRVPYGITCESCAELLADIGSEG